MSPRAREAEEISGPDRRVKIQPTRRVQQPKSRPYSWWDAQARALDGGACGKCKSRPTLGQYIPPTRATMNECAVIEKCRICGWERVVIKGRSGVPS